jgi:eukaryotic-like serine/threonine-protein kinase
MAVVFLAEDQKLNRLVALKFILGEVAAQSQVPERFQREARMMAKVEHPNVARAYFIGESLGAPYLVTRYLEGENLSERLKREGLPGLDRSMAFLDQAADALDAVHRAGIVHRDVKPSNLFIGPNDHLWLIDFGIAREVHDSKLTSTGQAVGTASYASPEVLLALPIDAQTDQYALALVACELLTGSLPFAGRSDFERAKAKLAGLDVHSLDERLPLGVRHALVRALHPTAAKRFESCQAFVEALRARHTVLEVPIAEVGATLRDLEPVETATRPQPAPAARRWSTWLAAAAITLAVGLMVWRAAGPQPVEASPEGTGTAPTPPATPPVQDPPEPPSSLAVNTEAAPPTTPATPEAAPNPLAPTALEPAAPTYAEPGAARGRRQELFFQVMFDGQLHRAPVLVDGAFVCKTPCSSKLESGTHRVQSELKERGLRGVRLVRVPQATSDVVIRLEKID